MAAFTGRLNSNEIFSALYNMIISQQVFSDNVDGASSALLNDARVDGSLYGDTKLYYATDVLQSYDWGNDSEAANLLNLYRPADPSCQAITLDTFRQIPVTVDQYLSKRAWGTEGAFGQFNSVTLGWIRDTKKVYDLTTYNCFIGTSVSAVGDQTQTVTLAASGTIDNNRLRATTIAQTIADILDAMSDVSRDYNDYQYLRAWSKDSIKVIFNKKYLNEITKVDLPTIFHKDFVDKLNDYSLNARYFGAVNAAATAGDGSTIRSLIEQDIGSNHYFAGDLIDANDTAPAGTSYTEDSKVICKFVVKLPPFMSAFETATDFFNPKSLTDTHYLTWGHNTLEYLKNYPMVTLSES